jgi:hypothetical protein
MALIDREIRNKELTSIACREGMAVAKRLVNILAINCPFQALR